VTFEAGSKLASIEDAAFLMCPLASICVSRSFQAPLGAYQSLLTIVDEEENGGRPQ
jgi:hypothetical protein